MSTVADTNGGRERWASRLGFILAAAGSAVGLGNIWKFPYTTGENGGGAFLIIYLAVIATLGISVLVAELVIGRAAARSPIGAFRVLGKRPWPLVGLLGVIAAFLILSFYTIVAGWTLAYALKMATGVFAGDGVQAGAIFGGFISDAVEPLIYGAVFMTLTVVVVLGGVRGGIERASFVLMPALFFLLIVLVVRALTLPGSSAGLEFFLRPDFSQVTGGTLTAALGQAFFSLSIGLGTMITYGSYMSRQQKLGPSAGNIVALDTGVAVLAGLVIFPAVFAAGVDPAAGPGLAFVTLPTIFAAIPLGQFFGTLFFVLLAIAALTSAVSLLEPMVSVLMDEYKLSRRASAIGLGIATFAFGIPSSLSLGPWADYTILGKGFLDLVDFVASNIMLPVGGLFIALFVGWHMGARAMQELDGGPVSRVWLFIIRFVAPVAIIWILVNGLII
jgi:NSS family neurotransmitter:Na+ symporter